MQDRYWGLTMTPSIAARWSTSQAVVPMPFFATKAASESLYVRLPASWTCPQQQADDDAVDFLSMVTYSLHALYERHRCSRRKVTVILNLRDWRLEDNFGLDDWLEFLDILQGHSFPVRVAQLLVVNAPSTDFGKLWRLTRPMLRQSHMRLHVLKDATEWPLHLPDGASVELLPDALGGLAPVSTLVQEFVNYRRKLEDLMHQSPQQQQQQQQQLQQHQQRPQLPVTKEEALEEDSCHSPGKDDPVVGMGSSSSLPPPGDTPLAQHPKAVIQRQESAKLPMVPSLIPKMDDGDYSTDEEEDLTLLTLQQDTVSGKTKPKQKPHAKRGRFFGRTASMPDVYSMVKSAFRSGDQEPLRGSAALQKTRT
jgi:hypothetical protein